jgi:hypothetical protein
MRRCVPLFAALLAIPLLGQDTPPSDPPEQPQGESRSPVRIESLGTPGSAAEQPPASEAVSQAQPPEQPTGRLISGESAGDRGKALVIEAQPSRPAPEQGNVGPDTAQPVSESGRAPEGTGVAPTSSSVPEEGASNQGADGPRSRGNTPINGPANPS